MDSGKSPGAKKSANRVTPPSSAYWAARLIERKHAEKTLEDRYGQLRARIEEQEAQLSALNEALRRASARPRARWLVGRSPKDDGPGNVSANSTEEFPVELLRVDVSTLQQDVSRQANELQTLRAELRAEAAQRAQAAQVAVAAPAAGHASPGTDPPVDREVGEALRKQRRELREVRALVRAERDARTLLQRKQDALEEQREEIGGLRAAVAEERGARVALEGRLAALRGEREESEARTRAEIARLDTALAQRDAEPGKADAGPGGTAGQEQNRKDLELQVARMQALPEEIARERAARTQEDAALQQAQAELQRRVADHSAVLRSVSSAMDRELAARREEQAQEKERQKRSQRDTVDLAKQLRGLSAGLEQEVADRKGREATIERAVAKLEQQVVEYASSTQSLERDVADRKRDAARFEQVCGDIERRVAEQGDAVRTLGGVAEQETADRKAAVAALERIHARVDQQVAELATLVRSLEREIVARKGSAATLEKLQEQVDGRVAECARELHRVMTEVARATAERARLQEGLADAERSLEAWRAERGARLAPASDLEESSCREVAIRSAGTLTILEGAPAAEESGARRDDIQVAMNGIIGLTELGLDTELTPAQREYLERVKSLAEEALAPARPSAAEAATKDDREPEPFRLREQLRDTLKPLLLRARQKGLKFSCQIAPRVPDQVFGHPGHLRQVIVNLVGNAIKFTDSGEISVCVDTASQSASVAALMVSVVDTGDGIPLDRQVAVLDALERTLPGPASGGLGLPISAELVRLMEGRLWFESDEDQGTKFRFTTRLGLQEAPRRSWWRLGGKAARGKGHTSAPRDGRVVLIADGNPGDRGALKDMLEGAGSTAVTVADGRGVLAALEHDAFDLIVMDLRMPGMDAVEAAATIRALEGTAGRGVPIVAIGAQLSALDERRCQVVGIDRCLAKPVQARRLVAITDELLRASSGTPSDDPEVGG